MNGAPTEQILPTPQPKKKEKESEKIWGKEVMSIGFCIIPAMLFRAQKRLGLNPTQLAVLLQIIDHWWEQDRKPYPSKKALSERLGLSPRQIQRHIAELEKAGLVQRNEQRTANGGKSNNEYDLSGLVERLKKLEPEFQEVKTMKKKAREMNRKVSQRGGLGDQIQSDASKP